MRTEPRKGKKDLLSGLDGTQKAELVERVMDDLLASGDRKLLTRVLQGYYDRLAYLHIDREQIARKGLSNANKRKQDECEAAEAQKQEALWQRKRTIAKQVRELVGEKKFLKIWTNGAEKRIYIKHKADRGSLDSIVDYYHTGNNRQPPRTLLFSAREVPQNFDRDALAALLGEVCSEWSNLELDCDK